MNIFDPPKTDGNGSEAGGEKNLTDLTFKDVALIIQKCLRHIEKASGYSHYELESSTLLLTNDDKQHVLLTEALSSSYAAASIATVRIVIRRVTPFKTVASALAEGTCSPHAEQRLTLYADAASQKIKQCWVQFKSPLPSADGRLFAPFEAQLFTTGQLVDHLFLHLCFGVYILRLLMTHIKRCVKAALPDDDHAHDLDPLLQCDALYYVDSQANARIAYSLHNDLYDKWIDVEITKDLQLLISTQREMTQRIRRSSSSRHAREHDDDQKEEDENEPIHKRILSFHALEGDPPRRITQHTRGAFRHTLHHNTTTSLQKGVIAASTGAKFITDVEEEDEAKEEEEAMMMESPFAFIEHSMYRCSTTAPPSLSQKEKTSTIFNPLTMRILSALVRELMLPRELTAGSTRASSGDGAE